MHTTYSGMYHAFLYHLRRWSIWTPHYQAQPVSFNASKDWRLYQFNIRTALNLGLPSTDCVSIYADLSSFRYRRVIIAQIIVDLKWPKTITEFRMVIAIWITQHATSDGHRAAIGWPYSTYGNRSVLVPASAVTYANVSESLDATRAFRTLECTRLHITRLPVDNSFTVSGRALKSKYLPVGHKICAKDCELTNDPTKMSHIFCAIIVQKIFSDYLMRHLRFSL